MVLTGTLRERVKKNENNIIEALRRQIECRARDKRIRGVQQAHDEELRRFRKVLDDLWLQLSSEWIPSVANKFADELSRRFLPVDLAMRQTLRRSVVDGMMAPLDSFPCDH
jgi:hypothetical protein